LGLLQQTNDGSKALASINQVGSITSCSFDPSVVTLTAHSLNKDKCLKWILDSGATNHISSSLSNYVSYNQIHPIPINLPDGAKVNATYIGVIRFNNNFFIKDVLHILNFAYNLISISKLICDHNCEVTFTSDACIIQDVRTKGKIGIADFWGGLYVLRTGLGHEENNTTLICRNVNKNNIWHVRLGHLSNQRLAVMKQQHPCIQYNMNDCCDVCHKSKQKRLPFPESFSHASNVFDLIHTDIWRPCSTASLNGERYFLTIVDDNTRFTWIFLMKSKAETRTHIINFVHYVKT